MNYIYYNNKYIIVNINKFNIVNNITIIKVYEFFKVKNLKSF